MSDTETINVRIDVEKRAALTRIAQQKGCPIDEVIESLLQEAIERNEEGKPRRNKQECLKELARIRAFREAVLARRGNKPLMVDTVALLHQIREERDAQLMENITSGNC